MQRMCHLLAILMLLGCWLPAFTGQAIPPMPLSGNSAPASITAKPSATVATGAVPLTTRVKDIARVRGARDNQLLGYGLVVGLNGTGDSTASQFTAQAVSSMLQRLGITVPSNRIKARNAAAVIITATIGPFVNNGDHLDVSVSSLGDASSLQGGILLQTPLLGADNKVYAVAQGAISLGGFSVGSGGSAKSSGHPTVGRIPGGALVEAEIPTEMVEAGTVTLALHHPDFTTATRMAAAINGKIAGIARARDAAAVEVTIPDEYRTRLVELLSLVGELAIAPDAVARVVINERTGTVVVGGNVTVAPVAVAQGNLSVAIDAALLVSQPPPLSREGQTVSRDVSAIETAEPQVSLMQVRGSTVEEFVRTLNALKVSARDIIAILQAMKQAGALQAELEII